MLASHVAVGAIFQQRCRGTLLWSVEGFHVDDMGVRHVHLRQVDNRLEEKTLALDAFVSRRDFLPARWEDGSNPDGPGSGTHSERDHELAA
ncbi:MAG TPA: hypothetical protein VE631_08375 [Alphaproteobacteria bacterium]|nr:hypothetical protein [Alphaproteobacteria bacterium]